RGLPHSHGDPHDLVIVEAGFGCNPAGCLLGAVDGLQRRIQRIGDPLFGHGKDFRYKLVDPAISPAPRFCRWCLLSHDGKRAVAANAVVCPYAPEMSTRSW